MLHPRIPEHAIPCDLLAKARGYPAGYAAAERVLQRSGWRYLISHDAWISPMMTEGLRRGYYTLPTLVIRSKV